MIKFENVTVVFLNGGDFIAPELLSEQVQREVDLADIVIDGGNVIKNRAAELNGYQGGRERSGDQPGSSAGDCSADRADSSDARINTLTGKDIARRVEDNVHFANAMLHAGNFLIHDARSSEIAMQLFDIAMERNEKVIALLGEVWKATPPEEE